MKKRIVVMGIFLLLILAMGCTLQDPRTNPSYSVIPEVLIDFDFNEERTKIWVKSAISDFEYDSIKMEITANNNLNIVKDNNTYCSHVFVKSKSFNMTILAISEDKEFEYNCRIRIELFTNDINLIIFDTDTNEEDIVSKGDLPYKKVLEEI